MINERNKPYIANSLKKQAKARIGKMLIEQVDRDDLVVGSVTDAMQKSGTAHNTVKNWLGGFTESTGERRGKEIQIDENTREAIMMLTEVFAKVKNLLNKANRKPILSVIEFL
jgi:hypothetical protein